MSYACFCFEELRPFEGHLYFPTSFAIFIFVSRRHPAPQTIAPDRLTEDDDLLSKTAARAPPREVVSTNRDGVVIADDRGRDAADDRQSVELEGDGERAPRAILFIDEGQFRRLRLIGLWRGAPQSLFC